MAYREPFNVTREPVREMAQSPVAAKDHSPWHSPVPYLFGGLAAMLCLIAFALVILACSYWKLSGYLEGEEGERDLEAGQEKPDDDIHKKPPPVYEEKILVIMAGQEKPTFLATPVLSSGRFSSFEGNSRRSTTCSCGMSENSVEMGEMAKQGSGHDQEQR